MREKRVLAKKKSFYKSIRPKDLFKKILIHGGFSRFRRFYLKIFYDLFPAKALLLTLKLKHPDSYKHCKAVSCLSADIYREYISKYGGKIKVKDIKTAALFHDIGKLFISEKILRKKHLSESEWKEIREHPEEGVELTEDIFGPKIIKSIAMHQEEADGSGYPRGLGDDDLNLAAKIISVADDFSAMTEKRGYNIVKTPSEALQEIIKSGDRYSERVVEALKTIFKKRYIIFGQKNIP